MPGDGNGFGAELRRLREARGWSLARAERETGIPVAVLGSYERGDRQPTATKLNEVLAHYGRQLVIVEQGTDLEDRLAYARRWHDAKQFFVDGYERIVRESA